MAPKKTLYGGETKKAVDNFPISGETVPPSVIHWLGRIKGAAARVNAELGKLDPALAESIAHEKEKMEKERFAGRDTVVLPILPLTITSPRL